MPFKPKNDKKIRYRDKDLITLDNTHNNIKKKINENRNVTIPNLKAEKKKYLKKVSKIQSKIDKGNYKPENYANLIEEKIEYEEIIRDIKQKIKNLDKWNQEYYLKNSKHIFSYFEKKKNTSKGMNKTKILESFFQKKSTNDLSEIENDTINTSFDATTQDDIDEDNTNKDDLFANLLYQKGDENTFVNYNKQFLINVDDSNMNIDDLMENHERCPCGGEWIAIENEGIQICNRCHKQDMHLVEHEKPSYREPPKEVCFYAYKRINHFKEIIAQFQGKETTQIPKEVIDKIKNQIKKERITLEQITNKKAKNILKKLGYNKYYEHIPFIKDKLGIKPPVMNTNLERKLCNLFMDIQTPYARHCPEGRVNFLNYYYVLYKMCELLGENEFLPHFPMLKDRVKRMEQDEIWKKICADLQWEYIPTL